MSVAKISEISASSKESFEDAISQGVKRANKTLRNIAEGWVSGMKVMVKNGKVTEYRVHLKVTFVLDDK